MKVDKYSNQGKKLTEVELPSNLFGQEVSLGAIYDAIKSENANLRSGNHSTKGRGEVSGGGKKPWQQKGSGRARQGSIRAPHFVGGGTIHGPKKRDYSSKLSRNIKKKAVISILNQKANGSALKVIEDFKMDKFSTKSVYNTLKEMKINEIGNVSLIVSGKDGEDASLKILKKSMKNIPFLKYIHVERITCRDLLYNNQLLISESCVSILSNHYGAKKK
jgi:large subunit ribosomal protein L4